MIKLLLQSQIGCRIGLAMELEQLQNMRTTAECKTENKMWLYEWMKWRWLCEWNMTKWKMKNGDGRNAGEEKFIGGIW